MAVSRFFCRKCVPQTLRYAFSTEEPRVGELKQLFRLIFDKFL